MLSERKKFKGNLKMNFKKIGMGWKLIHLLNLRYISTTIHKKILFNVKLKKNFKYLVGLKSKIYPTKHDSWQSKDY